jgi:hypothetical protein
MSKITAYSAIASVKTDDLLLVVDVHDTSMASTGTDKNIQLGQLPAVTAFNAKSYGAAGNGVTDDTTALTNWINDVNATTAGAFAYLPAGRYMVSSALPAVTAKGVTFLGAGWCYTSSETQGSMISATSSFSTSGTVFTVSGDGCQIQGITLDGGARAANCITIQGGNCRFFSAGARAPGNGGTCVNIATGGNSAWVSMCHINGVTNTGNGITGIMVNDTDLIVIGAKVDNTNTACVQILTPAGGAMIVDSHLTAGSGGGNDIWINGSPNNVVIANNRFDNCLASPVQISPGSSTPANIQITANQFQSKTMTANTFALIAVDTTTHSVNGLHIVGNAGYGGSGNLAQNGLAAQTVAGAASSSPTKIASAGSLFNSNNFWVNSTMYAASSSPTVGRGNIITNDGATYSAVTDI